MIQNKEGVILLEKPEGITSFSVLSPIKKKLKTKKVGHTGTLDKFASGLMIVLSGRFTSFNIFFTKLDKVYTATVQLGNETSTLDPEGEIVDTSTYEPTLDELQQAISRSFIGQIEQTPPLYSAIHVDGKRLYQYARQEKSVEIPTRQVYIYSLDIIEYNYPLLSFQVHCSSGTYVRSLARDLARACGSVGSLTQLRRDKVGPFSLSTAQLPDNVTESHIRTDFMTYLPLLDKLKIHQASPEVQELLALGKTEALKKLQHELKVQESKNWIIIDEKQNICAQLSYNENDELRFQRNYTPPIKTL